MWTSTRVAPSVGPSPCSETRSYLTRPNICWLDLRRTRPDASGRVHERQRSSNEPTTLDQVITLRRRDTNNAAPPSEVINNATSAVMPVPSMPVDGSP